MAKVKRREWFHVSRKYFGKTKVFKPSVPKTANMYREDIETPRISVCPTIRQCLVGIAGTEKFLNEFFWKGKLDNMYVYSFIGKAHTAGEVPDKQRTGEHWLLKPRKFKFKHKIEYEEFLSYLHRK